MSAPPLTRLRTENGQAAGPAEPAPLPHLPDELWIKVLMAVHQDNPCTELMKWCETEQKWANWCRDGTLYEAANRKLGWYGEFADLKAVQANVAGKPGFPIWTPPPTAKLYFQEVCKALQRARGVGSNPPWVLDRRYLERPYWTVIAERALRNVPRALLNWPTTVPGYADLALAAARHDYTLFDRIPKTLSNYAEIFGVVVSGGNEPGRGLMLSHVPNDRADFPKLAKLAVTQNGNAIRYVPEDTDGYHELAKIAMRQAGRAIYHVRAGRFDYLELAKLAMHQDGDSLHYIDAQYEGYGELARIAVAHRASVLNAIDRDRDDFPELAMIAVKKQGHMLLNVPHVTPNYDAICRAAVQEDGRAIQFVHQGTVGDDAYYEMAELAVKQNGMALRLIDGTKKPDKYRELAVLAILQTPEAVRTLDSHLGQEYDIIVNNALMEGARPETIRYVRQFYAYDYQELVDTAVAVDHRAIKHLDKKFSGYWLAIERAIYEDPDTLEYVPWDDNVKAYNRIALIAVDAMEQEGGVLQFVPVDVEGIDYYEIAKRALRNDGTAIRYVPHDYRWYMDLAEIAVRQSKYALGYVPKDHVDYEHLARLQAERMAPPSPDHDYGASS